MIPERKSQIFFIVLIPRSFSTKENEKIYDYLYKSLESIDLKLLIFFNTTDEWKFHFFNIDNIPEIEFQEFKIKMKNLIESYYDENYVIKEKEKETINETNIDNLLL